MKAFYHSIKEVVNMLYYLSLRQFVVYTSLFIDLQILHYVFTKFSQKPLFFELEVSEDIMRSSSLIVLLSSLVLSR